MTQPISAVAPVVAEEQDQPQQQTVMSLFRLNMIWLFKNVIQLQ